MLNFILLTLLFGESIVLSTRAAKLYRKKPFEPAAKSLLAWGLSTLMTILLLIIHTAFFSEYYPPIMDLTDLLWLKIPIRLLATTAALGIIYFGLRFTTWLTLSHFDSLRRSRFILGGQLVITGLCLIMAEIFSTDIAFYLFAIPFVAICLTYGVKMIFWFHIHAPNADPVRKWQLRLSEMACILLVIGPTDLLWDWEKLPFRPNLLLYIIGYALIILVGTKPEWFQNVAFAIENAPTLARQNIALLSMAAERHTDNPATKAEPWLRQLSKAIGLSSVQTHSLVRAAYLKTLVETSELSQLGLDTLSSPDTDGLIRYTTCRWDGHSSELSGNAIPIESRILSYRFQFHMRRFCGILFGRYCYPSFESLWRRPCLKE